MGVNFNAAKRVAVQSRVGEMFASNGLGQHHHRAGAAEATRDEHVQQTIADVGVRHGGDAAAERQRVQRRSEQRGARRSGFASQWTVSCQCRREPAHATSPADSGQSPEKLRAVQRAGRLRVKAAGAAGENGDFRSPNVTTPASIAVAGALSAWASASTQGKP